jgi:hypothetical protein
MGLGFQSRCALRFCSARNHAQPSDQSERLLLFGPMRGLGAALFAGPVGRPLSQPRPRKESGAQGCAMREWAVCP